MSQVKNSMRITYPSDEDFAIVCRIKNVNTKIATGVVLRKISEQQVQQLSHDNVLTFEHNERLYEVDRDHCFAFGEINLNDQDDLNLINSFKWTADYHGHFIPSEYDYNTNTGGFLTETFNNVNLFKFAHARIGKPKHIVCYEIRFAKRIE